MISNKEALRRLCAGNGRFVSDSSIFNNAFSHKSRCHSLTENQNPFAIILGCSDSRVPAEIIFDQGLGDLFVIRVAGNIVAPSQIGSIEFAVERFDTKLVVIMGHSRCGAIQATIDELKSPKSQSNNFYSIVDHIRPSLTPLLQIDQNQDLLLQQAVRANIRSSVHQLKHSSKILEKLVKKKKLLIIGAEYSLDTGIVTFFDK
ncbi:MAG: carbonic anhydrase [Nitrosomonadaceae bacterium]|nr:carbonic anhydrase [Nitrosomonadaceae bacterium]|tara:strand:- start:438 stop:1046 length:609 start_codon:yes stop_codon:yes gene_type:complete